MRSNLILLAFSVAFIAMTATFHVNYFDYEKPIAYSEWETITWTNFRGNNSPYRTLKGSRQFAFIETEIRVVEANDNIHVTSYFHPSRSYVFNKRVKDKPFLKHELLHFHITEYHARLLRKKIIEELNSNPDLDADDLLDAINEDHNSMQRAYDEETDHGLLVGRQKNWQNRIDSLLIDLDDMKYTVINRRAKN